MRMNRKAALAAGASLGIAFLAACSDSPTDPAARAVAIPKTSFAVGDATNSTPVVTLLKICKVGDASGTFTITDVGDGSASGNPTIVDDNAGVAGNQKTLTPGTPASPNCVIAVEDNGNATASIGDFFTVTEATAAGVTTETHCFLSGSGELPCPAQFFINTAHGWTVVVTNTAPPPPAICTFTKGWYQNKNGEPTIIAGIDGRSKADQIKIFNASPGQPGDVQWGVGAATDNKPNNLLNLYQQLLAALNNLGGNATAGPPAVDAAIASALAITSGTGTQIFVTPAGVAQISGLINTLSSFNQGEFANFPHCSDEVLQ
jgi:hypothetical protein